MFLSKKDVEFLSKKTKLSIKKVKLLTEEEGDLNLVLEQITTAPPTKAELSSLSFGLLIKVVIYHYSRSSKIDIKEKSYISSLFEKYIAAIYHSKLFKSVPKNKQDKDFAEYLFVLLGFFSDKIDANEHKKYKSYLYDYLRNDDDHRELFKNLEKWFDILNRIKSQDILVKSKSVV